MKRSQSLLLVLLSLMLLWTAGGSLLAQENYGQIVGRVEDPTSAVIAGVKVQATNVATNVVTSTVTSATGDYLLGFLIPGPYIVSAEFPGFRKFIREGIAVRIADKVSVQITMEVGDAKESIKVTSEAPLIEAASASLGQVMDNRRIIELPTKDGNPLMLLTLTPGVTSMVTGGWTWQYATVTGSVAVNGTKSSQNEFSMDGAPDTRAASVAYTPPPEVVQEFRVQTANFDASQGFTPGAVFNMMLKSGTNEIHGTAYHFLQNPVLNANDFFANRQNVQKAIVRMNRWGVNADGPVVIPKLYNGKNRTFWMFGYSGSHETDPRGTVTTSVPTPAERTGDFSALLKLGASYQLYDPYSTVPSSTPGRFTRQPLSGNIIPPNRISTAAQKLMGLMPNPNLPGTAEGRNNWTTPGPEWMHYYTDIYRVDHAFSGKHRFFTRGNVSKMYQQYNYRFGGAEGGYLTRKNRGLALDDVYVFSPTMLLNTRYSYTRMLELSPAVSSILDKSALGFSSTYLSALSKITVPGELGLPLPVINITDFTSLSSTGASKTTWDVHSLSSSLTHIVRSHSLRYGMEYRVYRQDAYPGITAGTLGFSTSWTRGPLDNSAASPMGQGLASFLYGLPDSGSITVPDSYAAQNTAWGVFVNDDWKVTSRLTVTLGLRWEMEQPITERYNRTLRGFDNTAALTIDAQVKAKYATAPIPQIPADQFRLLGGLTFAGLGGQPRGLWNADTNNLMPRIGLAYQVDRKTAFRAGYGLFYDQLGLTRRNINQSGYSVATSVVPSIDNGQTYAASLANPFPNGFALPTGKAQGIMTYVGQSISFYRPDLVTPYMQRWQFSVQREILPQTVLEIAYVGNRGTKIRISRNHDPIPRQYLSTKPTRDQATIDTLSAAVTNPFYPLLPGTSLSGTNVSRSQLLRPYPQFTSVTADIPQGYSWYHSLQTRFEKRFAHGYTFNAAWTWSKFMEAVSYLNETDPGPERMISDQDRTHRLAASGIYEFPFGKGRRWGGRAHGVTQAVLGGWQVSMMFQGQTGPPLAWGNILFYGQVKDMLLAKDQRRVEQWFNINAGFERTPSKALSSNIRTFPTRFSFLRGDGMNNWDGSFFKSFKPNERTTVQFRSELINLFNHPQFLTPDMTPANSTFGTVTAASQWPRTVQVGLKVMW